MAAILRAQTGHPDRPINLIVPFAAGERGTGSAAE